MEYPFKVLKLRELTGGEKIPKHITITKPKLKLKLKFENVKIKSKYA